MESRDEIIKRLCACARRCLDVDIKEQEDISFFKERVFFTLHFLEKASWTDVEISLRSFEEWLEMARH